MRRQIVLTFDEIADLSSFITQLKKMFADAQIEDKSDYLLQVPSEILFEILKFCDPVADIPAVSKVSACLYSACNSEIYWRNKFIEKGLAPALFTQIRGRITEYSIFYRVFLRVAEKKPDTLEDLITAIIEDYLQSCIKKDENRRKLFRDALYDDVNLNRGLSVIKNIYYREGGREILTDSEKQLVEIIAKLMDIDFMKMVYAYTRISSKYINSNGYH